MKKMLALLLALALLCPLALAEVDAAPAADAPDEGYAITDKGIDISLWENPSTGYQWNYEIDDETLLSFDSEKLGDADAGRPGLVGAPSMHTWSFASAGDGEALLSFYYERPWSEDGEGGEDEFAPQRTLCYLITVADGKVTGCDVEDLSEGGEGDADSVVQYQGETGGVPLEIPDGMTGSQSDEGTLLVAEDGLTKYLINYEAGDDAEELFERLKDTEAASAIYDDEAAGVSVISCDVDRDSDIQSVTLVYLIPDGIEEYTGYKAPDGGVLHVHVTYLLGNEGGEFDEDTSGDFADDSLEPPDDGAPAVG